MPISLRSFLLLTCMLVTSVLAIALKPTVKLADSTKALQLSEAIPTQFGNWTVDTRAGSAVVNPQQQALLDSIYSQTLSRTYVHASGRRIMLSLAYGGDQRHDTQIHKPEVCYPAQGFRLLNSQKDDLSVPGNAIPVMRLVAALGQRNEPITYWIRVGDKLVRGSVEQNLARIQLSLKGYIPDGILFRVSEISKDNAESFELQDQFIRDLLPALTPAAREFLVGSHGSST